jgi:hypothetical protein
MANGDFSISADINIRVRDLEERQRLIRDKLGLISKNFVELKEEYEKEVTGLRINLEEIKRKLVKLEDLFSRLSEELEGKAKRSDVEIIAKQLKMFQPLIKQ